jgi:hypothetical protein
MEQEICLFYTDVWTTYGTHQSPCAVGNGALPSHRTVDVWSLPLHSIKFQMENAWRYPSILIFVIKSWYFVNLKDNLLFILVLTLKCIFVIRALRKRSSRSWNAVVHRFMTRLLEPIFVKLHMTAGRKICWTRSYKLSLQGGRFELGEKNLNGLWSIKHKNFIKK